ncbi:hypothetical protein E4U31_002865 [Claviceps sp. LM219 group G6]|nr:hypothetical protein E4U31_002865 [Claviceps sp. LM219 group G6]
MAKLGRAKGKTSSIVILGLVLLGPDVLPFRRDVVGVGLYDRYGMGARGASAAP